MLGISLGRYGSFTLSTLVALETRLHDRIHLCKYPWLIVPKLYAFWWSCTDLSCIFASARIFLYSLTTLDYHMDFLTWKYLHDEKSKIYVLELTRFQTWPEFLICGFLAASWFQVLFWCNVEKLPWCNWKNILDDCMELENISHTVFGSILSALLSAKDFQLIRPSFLSKRMMCFHMTPFSIPLTSRYSWAMSKNTWKLSANSWYLSSWPRGLDIQLSCQPWLTRRYRKVKTWMVPRLPHPPKVWCYGLTKWADGNGTLTRGTTVQ